MDHLYFCVFPMLSRLFIAAMWSPAVKGLSSWLLLMTFIVFLLLSHLVSWVSCGTLLYRFLIFAAFLSFKANCRLMQVKSIADYCKGGILQTVDLH